MISVDLGVIAIVIVIRAILQSFRTRDSQSYCFVSYPENSLGGVLSPAEMQSVYFTALVDRVSLFEKTDW